MEKKLLRSNLKCSFQCMRIQILAQHKRTRTASLTEFPCKFFHETTLILFASTWRRHKTCFTLCGWQRNRSAFLTSRFVRPCKKGTINIYVIIFVQILVRPNVVAKKCLSIRNSFDNTTGFNIVIELENKYRNTNMHACPNLNPSCGLDILQMEISSVNGPFPN
jgi:hypothetical protein